MKRKLLIILLAFTTVLCCVLGLVACGDSEDKHHTHNWSSTYTEDGERHYQSCDGCSEKKYSDHDYGTSGICVCGATEPIESHTHNYQWVDNGDGTHKQHCSVNGCTEPDKNSGSHDYGMSGVCVCGKEKPVEAHTHNYQWVNNGDGTHKQHCSVNGCTEPDKNSGSHNYGTSGVCVCGKAEPVEVHTHNYQWVDNGNGTHKQHCSVSGCTEPDKNSGSHDYGTSGVCVCGKKEPVEAHTHNYQWVDSGDGTHKQHCSVDGCSEPDINSGSHNYGTSGVCVCGATEPVESHTHTWNSGEITMQPTCKDYGVKTYTCTVCGETKTEQVAKLTTHTYNDWTSNGNESHIHSCSVCNISETQKHIWDSGNVTEQPTCKDYGVKTYTCTVCGETKTEQVAKLITHTFMREQADTEYLKTAATCTDKAVYYLSCLICYEKSTETFEYGNANGHSFGDWTSDGDITHSHTCSECNETVSELHDLTVSTCICGKENCTDGLYFELNGDQVSYSVYVGTAIDSAIIIIPSKYNGYPVTIIGESAFRDCTSFTSVTIPDHVTIIGESAFQSCTSLTSITIPSSVTSIGRYAFYGCSSLESITISDSVTSIDNAVFYGCSSLESVTISDNVTSIGDHAFGYCTSLTSVILPDSVTSIGVSAFIGGKSLISITIPDSVTSIGESAFDNCFSLTSVTIGNGITSISDYAFHYCNSLTSVTIPDSVTSISNWAFQSCTSLTSVTIPNSVTSIGNEAFRYCNSLTSVTIGNSVTSIGNYAFHYCNSLTSVTIPDSVTSISDHAFHECSSLTSVTIGHSVTSISDHAFDNCFSLTSITIPDSVTSIGDYAFHSCIDLTTVYFNATDEEWANISIGSNNECLLNANIIYMHTHDYSESVVEPTCTQQGYTLYVCECGKEYTDNYVPANGHTEVTVAGVAATCTKTGLTEGKYCSVCNTVIVAQTEIPVKEHSVVIDKAVDATCTKTGLTEGNFCSVCRTVFIKQQTIEALGHNYENGKCTNCGQIEPNYWDGTVAEGFARGSGTQDDPYIIETAAQLAYLSSSASEGNTYSGKYIALVHNIDLNGMEWTPIKSFAGNFDGNGYNISNFKITTASNGYIGLFANVLSDSSLQNINLEAFTIDVTYAGNIYAGGLAGSSSGTIDNCSANGSVSITTKNNNYYAYGGGLVGNQSGKTITNSYAIGTVYVSASRDGYAGGLVGNNSATVSYCYSNCNVTATIVAISFSSGARKCYIGGLIGYQGSKTISCSFATGNINTYSSALTNTRAGGLVGYNDGGTISNVYATGNVTATADGTYTVSGGLVGDNNAGTISNGYALGTVKASSSTKSYEGGLLGYNDGYGKISNCYATGNTSNIGYMYYKSTATKCYNYYGKALPTKDFLISTLGWSEEIWTFFEDGYPILKNILC